MTTVFEPVIGLEVHVQLKTKTKAFCGCVNEFGGKENTHVCPVCLGLPGSLPVLNHQALQSAVRVALALNCTVRTFTKFDRKNYYYPDLPKNFQISQYDMPFSEHGYLDIENPDGRKRIRVKRVHLEEDAGKLIHDEAAPYSYVDYNRAGTPLLEIVSEPDIFSPQEAYDYLTVLKLMLQYLEVSDCDMEKGTLRCDANVSVRPKGQTELGVKTELKNLNSFKAVRAALEYEIKRLSFLAGKGERIVQETRLWDDKKQESASMRSKEQAHDYRYFPEPDLPPFTFTERQIQDFQASLPELPQARHKRLIEAYELSAKDAGVLVADKALCDYFEGCLKHYAQPKKVANWIMGPVLFQMNQRQCAVGGLRLTEVSLTELIRMVDEGVISNLVAKDVLTAMIDSGKKAADIVAEKNLAQVSGGDELLAIIDQVIAANPKSVEDYRNGKENALMFLVGGVMKLSKGKANPKVAREMIAERLQV